MIPNINPCTRVQISPILKKIDISKSKVLDGIGNGILKQLSTRLSVSLHCILKTCLNKGKYLSQWKEYVVESIYKDENNTAIHNYRPINCLSCQSNVFENTISGGLFNCNNDQIHDSQYGLPAKRSTTANFYVFLIK